MDALILKNLIVFCILMENNDGILAKSPDYIEEKYQAISWGSAGAKYLLDSKNLAKFNKYIERWKIDEKR